MKHVLAWSIWAVTLAAMLTLGTGCADVGRLGARMSGLQVVDVNGCSYTSPKAPCKPVETPQP
jgi:hypothetical protein